MSKEVYECSDCGKVFGSEETLQEHSRLEHGHSAVLEQVSNSPLGSLNSLKPYLNASFGFGLVLGILLTVGSVAAYDYAVPDDPRHTAEITVLTCDNCSYDKFRSATDRLFKTEYREVDYQSEEGQRLIDKYGFTYVPGFIFDKESLMKTENYTLVRPVLVEFEDAYVMPDEGVEKAQMLSDGVSLRE